MNIVYKKASALVFSAIVTTSAYGVENENMTDAATKPVASAAWYKKGSVQAAAVAATLAVVGYVVAIRTGRVIIPALMPALTTGNPVQNDENTNSSEIAKDIESVDGSNDATVDTNSDFDVSKLAEKFVAEVTKTVLSEKQMKKIFQELY